ncbi:MAG: L-aspartate oxidase [Sedimentisphaerales bacterium]|nr:L-aspartate oxidase [Sedimentisphaerales bacterium]
MNSKSKKPVKTLRRYLAHIDTSRMGHIFSDCIVIGSGVAGLRAALAASEQGNVMLITKGEIPASNSYYAQGGIAAVMRADDSFESHIDDTLRAGCGLCDLEVVERVIREAPGQMQELCDWQTPFDRTDGELDAGREGGHSNYRIAHAHGDATGRAIVESLWEQVKSNKRIKILDNCFCIDLLTAEGRCVGVVTWHNNYRMQCCWSGCVVLASGGAGRIWRETTNPEIATGDGLAMAWRAGAILSDLEFMQFHPTTLYIAGAERSLITEALRGAGAYLLNSEGRRFMDDYHEMGELAPRDIVSRAIFDQMARSKSTSVYLDVRHLGGKMVASKFPTISALCASFDIDVDHDLIPVRPSAHYMIGGVKTDADGRTNLPGLYCCGEAACTGLHGANRLASNSLLEALVFGRICGENVCKDLAGGIRPAMFTMDYEIELSQRTRLDVPDVTNSLKAMMWRNVGLTREEGLLSEAIEIIDFWQRYVMDKLFDSPDQWQCQNMLTVSELITRSALQRTESRGVHYRTDYPETDASQCRHSETEPAQLS